MKHIHRASNWPYCDDCAKLANIARKKEIQDNIIAFEVSMSKFTKPAARKERDG